MIWSVRKPKKPIRINSNGWVMIEVLVASTILAVGLLICIQATITSLKVLSVNDLRMGAFLELEYFLNGDIVLPQSYGELSGESEQYHWKIIRTSVKKQSYPTKSESSLFDELLITISWNYRGKKYDVSGIRVIPSQSGSPKRSVL